MRVLITGGAGFIGSHLCDSLVAAGSEVNILDNLSTGSKRNIAHLKGKIHCNHYQRYHINFPIQKFIRFLAFNYFKTH